MHETTCEKQNPSSGTDIRLAFYGTTNIVTVTTVLTLGLILRHEASFLTRQRFLLAFRRWPFTIFATKSITLALYEIFPSPSK